MLAPKIDASTDRRLLESAARAAGQMALQYFKADPQVWDKGAAGPVTEADLAIDRMLRTQLLRARPTYGWLSEETEDDPSRLWRDQVFIVDPIDGTRAFINGESSWGISVAIARAGQITAASVYMPVMDRLFSAGQGDGATLNGGPIHTAPVAALDQTTVLSAKPNLRADYWHGPPPPLKRHYRPSLAYRMSLVAQGRYGTMLTLRPTWEWDIAAGCLLVQEAGGAVRNMQGDPLVFNSARAQVSGVLAGPGPTIDALVALGPKLPTS